MTDLTAVVDIDYIKYTAASAGETRTIKAYHPIDGVEFEAKTRTELWGHYLKKDKAAKPINIDNAPPATGYHAIEKRLGSVKDRVQISAQHCIPVGLCQFAQRCIPGNSCVVDDDVDLVTIGFNERGQLLAGFPAGHIGGIRLERVSLRRLLRQPVCGCLRVP